MNYFFQPALFSTIVFQPTKLLRDREFRYIFNINSFLQPNHKKPSEKKKKKISIVVLQASFSFFFFHPFEFIPFFFELKNIE